MRSSAHKDAEVVALSDVYEPYLNGQFDKIHPHFKDLTYRVPSRLPDFGGPVSDTRISAASLTRKRSTR